MLSTMAEIAEIPFVGDHSQNDQSRRHFTSLRDDGIQGCRRRNRFHRVQASHLLKSHFTNGVTRKRLY